MCPPTQPPPPREIGLYWSDEQIISLLADYIPGCCLPDNVLEDSSLFLYPPSAIPEGKWFLIHSNERKESVHGYWKAKGESCKVYSNKAINGWRSTLEHFEGLAPNGRLTDWRMQEYMITPAESSHKYRPKDSILLCRVFLCSDGISKSNTNTHNCKITTESKNIDPVKSTKPDTSMTSDQEAERDFQAKRESDLENFPNVSDAKPNSPPEEFSELECFSRGDFLELDDLEDPESHSSSSRNSSCLSKLSEEYFGSADFLHDLEEEIESSYKQERHSSSGYRFMSLENKVVLQPPPSGVMTLRRSSSGTEHTLTGKRHSTERHHLETKTEGTSNTDTSPGNASSAPAAAVAATSEERKASSSRMKKFRTYFCFAAF